MGMKKIKFLIVFLFIVTNTAFAQKNIIKTNPIGDIFGVYNIGYERQITDSNSIVLSLYNFDFTKFNGNIISGEYRFYTNEEKPSLKGFFVSPSIYYFNVKEESNEVNEVYNEFGVFFNLGHQWTLFKNVTFDWFFGLGFVSTDELNNSNLGGILSFNIGYQW